jgi:hypothetical protein
MLKIWLNVEFKLHAFKTVMDERRKKGIRKNNFGKNKIKNTKAYRTY